MRVYTAEPQCNKLGYIKASFGIVEFSWKQGLKETDWLCIRHFPEVLQIFDICEVQEGTKETVRVRQAIQP